MVGERKTILVVDDDLAILRVLSEILESKGYTVDTAETGREAIVKSKAKYYSLALLDIRLPDIEGTELLIKMHRATPKMMKIVVTGYPSLENAIEAVNKGADAYVTKPVDPERLLRVVEEKLREQEEAENMTEDKVTEWIRTRARRLDRSVVYL